MHGLASSADVEASAELARRAGRFGIDTEFMSEGRYRALLCLTQVAVEDASEESGIRTILIDGLDQSVDVRPLAALLADPGIEIVLHAGRQDVAILRRAWSTRLTNIFDTQIAAGFVGESAQSGYGNLIGSVLGLRVGKTASYTRWDARPLTSEQLSYAAEDVAHLLQLADEIQRRLRASGREQWALEECRRLETASDERDPETAWERLPRVGQLDPQARAVARRLASWRERTASREDRPVGQVLQDPPLLELAKRHPRRLDALGQIRGIHPSFIKRRGGELLEQIAAGLADPPIPREARRGHSDSTDTPLIALAEALLRARAMEAGLAYELIASRSDLEQIIAASRQAAPEPDVRTLSGWRRELVGSDLESLLSGRTAVAVGSGRRLELHPIDWVTSLAMATAEELLSDPELLASGWDLEPIVEGEGGAGVERLLDEALARGASFAESYTGRVATLDGSGLREAMLELAAILELVDRAGSYAMLQFTTDTADPARGALLQRVQERGTTLETQLLFFELEWAALEDDQAEALLTSGADLGFCAHHLRSARRYRPHLLSEPEEKVMAEKSLAASAAWARLFGEQVSAIRVDLDGNEAPLDVALSGLLSPDRELRRRTAEAVTAALEPGLRTRAFIFNTLVYDKSVDDRLRRYPHWLAARNLANEASDESVLALIHAVRDRYDIPQRWYRLKARLLGVDRLADYDRNATIASTEPLFSYAQAREMVVDTYTRFSPEAGAITRRFFDESWIDAPVRDNKRGGAFCATVAGVHPYVMLNYTARRRDVLTIAHELGHGLHSALAEKQGIFHQGTPLTVAETASVFGETLVFERLLAESGSDVERLELLAGRIDDAIATVFRQMAMNRFEHLVHTRRRSEGELSVDDISQAWVESQAEMLGEAVEITDGYRCWWSYVPHFINSPGYVYAYAYGQLLALSVYGRYREVGDELVPRYLEMLAAGGSRTPESLGEIVGIDLADPGFWDAGLRLVDEQLLEAEALAERVKPAS